MIQNHPLFAQFALSTCQKAALVALERLISGDHNVGILRGYAGTGKTFLTALLVKYISTETDFNVVVMTPTGRAAKVIEGEFDKHKIALTARTIHSVIYKAEPIDYSRNEPTLFASVGSESSDVPCFYIIDESSMVGNEKRAPREVGLNFGSGSLLHDIIDYANLRENKKSRVLFVGDPGQLPPVQGREHTPALSAHELLTVLTELEVPAQGVVECDLNTVLRQDEGSLKHFVTEVRESLHSYEPLPRKRSAQVNPIAPEEIVNLFLSRSNRLEAPSKCVILAHSNASVYSYNRRIRHAIGWDDHPLVQSEILLVRRNRRVVDYGELNISRSEEDLTNGTFIQVVEPPDFDAEHNVIVPGGLVRLRFWRIVWRKLGCEKSFTAVVVANMLDESFWRDYQRASQELERAILIDFQQRMLSLHNLKPPKSTDIHYHRYKRLAETDPYLNALRVNYGYAVTVHNAQGGEWDTVIVDPRNPSREYNSVQHHVAYTRWIYTASTRARKDLWFVK